MEITVKSSNKKYMAYLGLVLVILVWGIAPLITLGFYRYYSPTIRIAFGDAVSILALLLICRKKLHLLDKTYLRVAVPTGFFMALANILQKIGLQYTTPAHYAFLENLSCIAVPVLMPFSSVVTTVASVLLGSDTLSWNLVIGAMLGLAAIILSGFGDRKPEEKTKKSNCLEESC